MTENERLIADILKGQAFKLIAEENGKLRYPFVQPGLAYKNTLWDWDSYWTVKGLADLCRLYGMQEQLAILQEVAKGDVLNFLDFQEEDGFIPCMLRSDVYDDDYSVRPNVRNVHKPFLCQQAMLAVELGADARFVPFEKLEKYLEYYYANQYDEKSGLFVWADDIFLGGDNNPTVFARPDYTSADVYLNGFMVGELQAMCALAKAQGKNTAYWQEKCDNFIQAVNREMYDKESGFYYSQDVSVVTHKTEIFHLGLPAFWKTVPLKIKMWACYIPLIYGIAPPKNAAKSLLAYKTSGLYSEYGIRTVSKHEKMYNLEPSGNPSNWLGAIWTVANYILFRAFMQYGYLDEAEMIKTQTESYLVKDIEESGSVSESYHPDTGERFLNNEFFSFNCLYASMVYELEQAKSAVNK